MNIYHIWCDKNGLPDDTWVKCVSGFLQDLVEDGKMESFRITRCKLGFRSFDIPEWHIMMEFKTMAQLDSAFDLVAKKDGELEDKHRSFNMFVGDNIHHALYRDYPDNV